MAPSRVETNATSVQSNGTDAHASTAGVNGSAHATSNGHHKMSNGDDAATNGLHTAFNGHHMTSNGNNVQNDIPVAVVGMATRLPGGIYSGEDLWDTLINKKDKVSSVPEDRWNNDAFHSTSLQRGSISTKLGYFLESKNLRNFDTSFFQMTRAELDKLDPQHRLLLEVSREALENAGEVDWRGKDTGCYVGVFGEDWLDLHAKDTQTYGGYRITGAGDFVLANRLSYEYDFRGPSVTIKTACSASLVALNMANEAIRSGNIPSALVGGSNLIMSPTMTLAMSEQGIISPEASCNTFDASAKGYARAEAISALYLKRLDHALRDGNPIRAIVRSTGTNCDGKTNGITLPNPEAHESLIRRTYSQAGLDPGDTCFVECHGTGTEAGDPIEMKAISKVFGEKGVYITSHKPNLGHSEGASGLTSCIKAVMALEKKIIPPQIKFKTPNPKIPFEEAKLKVPVEATPWPKDRRERVSINAFGIGGANAHAVFESAESFGVPSNVAKPNSETPSYLRQSLVVTSANHINSARESVANIQDYLDRNATSVKDVAYTTGLRRELLPYRAFAVCGSEEEGESVEFSAPARAPASAPAVTFVFTGQGAQWPTMGRKLMEDFPSVAEDFRGLDEVLSKLPDPPVWKISDELSKSKTASKLDQAEFAQPLCTAIQIVIVNLLRSWNIIPSAVIGHSSGELAAAYASGAITSAEAMIGAYYRGMVANKQSKSGAMAAVGLGREDASKFLREGVVIACENSPESVTFSGDADKIDILIEEVKESHPEVLARRLRVNTAYHSPHMVEFGAKYEDLLEPHVSSRRPEVPFYSTVLNKVITKEEMNASYWRKNLESPVLFNTALANLLSQQPQDNLFLEVGPHSALGGPIRQILKQHQRDSAYVPTLIRNEDDTTSLLTTAGNLFVKGLPIDLHSVNGKEGSILTDLPRYPWNHEEEFWIESRVTRDWRLRKFKRHDLLGSRVFEVSEQEPAWRNMLCLEDIPWISDHVVNSDIVFPAAGYIGMIGEAIHQVTGAEDHTIRDLTIKSAMILEESRTTEIVTNLRPQKLTTTLDSTWWEFSISSHNGTGWTKHCSGKVKSGRAHSEFTSSAQTPQGMLPRKVDSTHWYRTMSKVSMNYGPHFQGLNSISAHPGENAAAAACVNLFNAGESGYALHPTTIDYAIQLLSVASTRGQSRDFNRLVLPQSFSEVYLSRGPGKNLSEETFNLSTSCKLTARGAVVGECSATLQSSGEAAPAPILEMKGVKLVPAAASSSAADEDPSSTWSDDPHAGARTLWKPSVDFLPMSSLIHTLKGNNAEFYPRMQEMMLLVGAETIRKLDDLAAPGSPDQGHLQKFRAWLKGHVSDAEKSGIYDGVPDVRAVLSLEPGEEREARIAALADEFASSEIASPISKALLRVFENIREIFEGGKDPLDVLMTEGHLRKLYDIVPEFWDLRPFLDLVSHERPHLRILEVGAGTGAMTKQILEGLVDGETGDRMYYSYTYTDISSGFFVQAKERFKDYAGIEYSVFDCTQDPGEQGFEVGGYDLVFASNVIHATPSLGVSLANVRKLLRPKGRLVLQELCCSVKWFNYIVGVLSGWWLGEEDGRPLEPYVSPERWTEELIGAGFDSSPTVLYDDQKPYNTNATIIATPAVTEPTLTKEVYILTEKPLTPTMIRLKDVLAKNGYVADNLMLGETPEQDRDIISVLDLEGKSFFTDVTEQQFNSLQQLIVKLESSGLLWLTRSCQLEAFSDPQYAQVVGMSRVIRNELDVDFAVAELDDVESDSTFDKVVEVLDKFQARNRDEDVNPDVEYAISKGVVNVPRYHWTSVSSELSSGGDLKAPKSLEIGTRGSLKTLRWVQSPLKELGEDDVAIEVKAVGMNFKDLLIAMGVVDGNVDDGSGLGCECAGVITAAGANSPLRIGDRVMAVTLDSYATVHKVPSDHCVKIPDNLSFEDASTMGLVYATAMYSLLDVAKLEKGQSVLIHSACGGVGIAAIHLARMVGAEIYATVGAEEKVEYLMKNFDIPRNRIFNSRNASFLPDLLRETNGVGVNVVLNSLSGDLLHSSWRCVAEFGKMVEIGKRDLIGHGQLALDPFEANRSYHGVDLVPIIVRRPKVLQGILRRIIDFFRYGLIQPITTTLFDAENIEDAFRFMQKGSHIGKLVVRFPEDPSVLPTFRGNSRLQLRPEVSYLLIGGLGGLGRAVTTWMAQRGARHFVYLSRSGGKGAEDAAFVKEMDAAGCTVEIIAGSVAVLEDVKGAIEKAKYPIAGILQMAMVLDNAAYANMSHDQWQNATLAKIKGTWTLHEAFASQSLDFFVLCSSIAGQTGHLGQANYAAANTFLDSFVQFRHGQGLPASVLDIAVVEDVGWVSTQPEELEYLKAVSNHCLREQEFLECLELTMMKQSPPPSSSSQTGYMNPSHLVIGLRNPVPIASPDNRSVWKRDRRMGLYRNIENVSSLDSGSSNEGLREFMTTVNSDPNTLQTAESIKFLATEIGTTLFGFLMKPVEELDIQRPLSGLGMDSLVAIELRSWCKQRLGTELSVLEILDANSIEHLGKKVADGLLDKFGGPKAVKAKMGDGKKVPLL